MDLIKDLKKLCRDNRLTIRPVGKSQREEFNAEYGHKSTVLFDVTAGNTLLNVDRKELMRQIKALGFASMITGTGAISKIFTEKDIREKIDLKKLSKFTPPVPPNPEVPAPSAETGKRVVEGVEIESGIPVPPRHRRSTKAYLRKVLKSLRVGDSFKRKTKSKAKHVSSVINNDRKVARELGIKLVCRREPNDYVRIWRIE